MKITSLGISDLPGRQQRPAPRQASMAVWQAVPARVHHGLTSDA